MVQPFLHTNIGKDRLNDCQPSGIDRPAMRIIDLCFHLLDQTEFLLLHLDGQIPAGCIRFAQTLGSCPAVGAILRAGTINIINPVTIWLVAGTALQNLALRAEIDLPCRVKDKISKSKGLLAMTRTFSGMDAMLEPLLIGKLWIALAELHVGDVSIQAFLLTENQAGMAEIIAVCAEGFADEKIRTFPNIEHILFGTGQHGSDILMILTIECLSMQDDLVLFIDKGLGIVALNDPMRGGHLGGLVVGDIALHFFAALPDLGCLFIKEVVQALNLME